MALRGLHHRSEDPSKSASLSKQRKILDRVSPQQSHQQLACTLRTVALKAATFNTGACPSPITIRLITRLACGLKPPMSQCKACDEPLILRVDDDEDEGATNEAQTVPDDLELGCGCHFHWYALRFW